MPDDYSRLPAARYLEIHDAALADLKALFEKKADGTVDFIDHEAAQEQVQAIIDRMAEHAEDSIKTRSEITGSRNVAGSSSRRISEAVAFAERIEIEVNKLQALFENAVMAKNFWGSGAEKIVSFYKGFLQQNPRELAA